MRHRPWLTDQGARQQLSPRYNSSGPHLHITAPVGSPHRGSVSGPQRVAGGAGRGVALRPSLRTRTRDPTGIWARLGWTYDDIARRTSLRICVPDRVGGVDLTSDHLAWLCAGWGSGNPGSGRAAVPDTGSMDGGCPPSLAGGSGRWVGGRDDHRPTELDEDRAAEMLGPQGWWCENLDFADAPRNRPRQ